MADWYSESFSNPYGAAIPEDDGNVLFDAPLSVANRAAGIGADLGAVVRALGESRDDPDSKAGQAGEYLGKFLQGAFGELEDMSLDAMSEENKRALQSSLTDPNFWTLNSIAMKSANMAPDIIAAAIPSMIFPGVGTAVAVSAAQGGAFSAASVVDDMYAMIDETPDADLQKQVPMYRELRESGVSEEEARRQHMQVMIGMRPLVAGAIGAITNVFGPAGQAARAAGGAAAHAGEKLIARVGKSAAEGAISEGIQSGTESYVVQEGAVAGDVQDEISIGQVAEEAAGGAVMGGLLGGAVGGVTGRPEAAAPETAPEAIPGTDTEEAAAPPPSASGAMATPGIDIGATASVAQDMQAVKNYGKNYADLSADQKAEVDAKLTGRGIAVPAQSAVAVVDPAGADPAQTAAIASATPQPTPKAAPQATAPAPVAPQTAPPISTAPQATAPAPIAPVTTEVTPPAPVAPVAPVQPQPVSAQPTPPVQQTRVETPVAPAPVLDTARTPEAAPSPALAESAPIREVGKPRVLEDMSPEAQRLRAEAAKENAAIVRSNIKAMEAPVEGTGKKRSAEELEGRSAVSKSAAEVAMKYPPVDAERLITSKKPAEVTAAKQIMLARATAISDEFASLEASMPAKARLPARFKDNTDADQNFSPETLLVMEARRLAKKAKPTKEDFERFARREFDIRSGAVDQAIAERREQGAIAMDQSKAIDVEMVADDLEASGTLDPEAALIAKQEAEREVAEGRQERELPEEQRVPKSIEKALDEAMYTVPSENRRAPVVEAKKSRKIAPKLAETKARVEKKVTPKVTPKPEPKSELKPYVRPHHKQYYSEIADSIENGLKTWPDGNEVLEGKRDLARRLASLSDEDYAKAKEALHRDMEPGVTMEPEKGMAALDRALGPQKVTPKVTDKVAAIKERVAEAREQTNTNPTPAQAVSGNYKKGRVSIHGVEVAIENPKGSIRTNKDPNGPKWKVKLPVDYGYIEGTNGVDGDPVDVYLGADHDASYVYVIDQLDFETRAFDEHKVMMGFKNEQAALKAYDAAFSDGNGMLRVGDMRKMTLAEFKDWVSSDPRQRSGMSEADAAELRSFMFEDEFDAFMAEAEGPVPEGMIQDPFTNERATPVSTVWARDIIGDLDLNNIPGVPRVMAQLAARKLREIVGEVEVHFVTPDDMARLTNRVGRKIPAGYHAHGETELVVVRYDLMNDPIALRHTVLHELTHAATVKALDVDPVLKDRVRAIMNHVDASIFNGGADFDTRARMLYSMNNEYEFVAEVFSNPHVQEILAHTPAPRALAEDIGAVRTLWGAFLKALRQSLKFPNGTTSVLELSIRVTEQAMRPRATGQLDAKRSFLIGDFTSLNKSVKSALKSIEETRALAPTKGNPALLGLRTFDSIARNADRYFRGNNVVRKIADLIEGQRVAAIKEFDRAAPVIQKLFDLEHKYKAVTGEGGRTVWENFTTLVHDETMAGVYADRPLAKQSHISKNGSKDSWARKQFPALAKAHDALPQELKDARLAAMNYFRDKQNEVALKLIRNRIVTLFDTPDPEGLAQRIHDGSVTDADKALMGEAYDAIAAAGVLSKIEGPYFPLMRRGNYVVKGRYKIKAPAGATKIADNEFEFKSKDDATKFAEAQGGRPTMRTIYVDKNTGSRTGTENGKTVRLTAQDIDAEPRYRVVVQDRHMEMFDSMRKARRRVAELRKAGIEVDDAVPRSFENYGVQADALSIQMRKMNSVLERRADARQFTDEQKKELLGTLNELSLSMLGSTRIQSRALPRQYVAGASKDLLHNTTEYAHAMGNYIAKLDFRPKLDAALSEMTDMARNGPNDGLSAGRTAIMNEVLRRVTAPHPALENKFWNGVSSRVLTMSFIDKLMSPSYSFINATQPMMISAPYLAGQYGAGRAYAALAKAYNDIGSLKAIREGLAATAQKAVPGSTIVPSDPVSLIRSRVGKAEQMLLDILVDRGVLDTDSALEVTKLTQSHEGVIGKFDATVGYLEGIARQMPKTVEAMNRSVVAIAAFRLEMDRSGDMARAVQFAQDTLNLTQFNYSASNAAPYMNHPALRLMLQFKKYGVGMYQFMGEQVAIAVRNEKPGDRARALKSLSYTIGMHVLMAGAMGLPVEPIKLVVLAANGLGVVDWSWADVENAQRELAADMFGKDFGEVVARGVPRALGIDLSSRMGIDTLIGPFGEPRSNEAQDWKAYVWDTVAGAPAGLVTDWAKGVNDLAQGDIVRAMERLVPIKAFSDSVKAYRAFTEGNVSETSGKQTMSPYSAREAVTRAMGFTPAREAENNERRSAYFRQSESLDAKRGEFQKEWAQSNGAARGRLWREIQKWNRTQPMGAKLSLSDLRDYQKRIKRDMEETKEGIKARKNTEQFVDRADRTYNFQP